MDNFQVIIENDHFIKDLKRMFITKQMEVHNIKQVFIEYNDDSKSFHFNIIKDDHHKYNYNYKIKRRKVKQKENNKVKKRKLNNENTRELNKNNNVDVEYFDSSKHDFNEIKISSPTQNTPTNKCGNTSSKNILQNRNENINNNINIKKSRTKCYLYYEK